MKKSYTNEQFIYAVKTSRSYREVMIALGLSPYGFNYNTLYRNIKRLNLSIDHFYSKLELLEIAKSNRKKLSDEELFTINQIDRKYVKKRILEKNLIPYCCEICKLTSWQEKEISLHLDHKNGNNTDNRLENLRFLCPNCHSQTETYCGKNIKHK